MTFSFDALRPPSSSGTRVVECVDLAKGRFFSVNSHGHAGVVEPSFLRLFFAFLCLYHIKGVLFGGGGLGGGKVQQGRAGTWAREVRTKYLVHIDDRMYSSMYGG